MLDTPTPFPQTGSYALLLEDGFQLVRIQGRGHDGQASISFPLRPDVASGNRTVELEELTDGTPLTAAERQRLSNLERQILPAMAADDPHRLARSAELATLKARDNHACLLAELMARLPSRAGLGAVEEAEA